MGYSHSWELNTKEFTQVFLDDVRFLLRDYVDIIEDLKINKNLMFFNGSAGYGCDTFRLDNSAERLVQNGIRAIW